MMPAATSGMTCGRNSTVRAIVARRPVARPRNGGRREQAEQHRDQAEEHDQLERVHDRGEQFRVGEQRR
jgi:hypothetical protein